MLTKEELQIKAEKMQKFLEQKPGSEPNDLIERAENLSVLIAQSGQCLADAKYLLDSRKGDSITKALADALQGDWSTTIIHKKIDSLCKEENYMVNLFDRINSTAGKQLMSLNTILSYRKSEMNLI